MNVISLKGTNMELTDAIKEYVDQKLEAIEKLTARFDPVAELSIECGRTSNHHNKGDVYRCEMNMHVPGADLRAERDADDLYAAIDLCKDELVRQLKDEKEQRADRDQRAQRPDKV